MSDQPTWYYVGSHGQIGPLTAEQIIELIQVNVVEPSTLVWNAGWSDWRPAKSAIEFENSFAAMASINPPPTPAPPAVPTYATPYHASPYNAVPMQTPPPCPYSPMFQGSVAPNKSRLLAGLLQLFVPGVGRMYLGHVNLGIMQLVAFILTCGLFYLWTVIDAIYIFAGGVKNDASGNPLQLV
jgi:TM2 domain-containing membrane protein YozV